MSAASRKNLPSLTGLRAPAAFAVFVYHMQWMAPGLRAGGNVAAADLLDRVALRGYVGVSFFFILSGFVLTWSRQSRDTAPSFWWRRAVRLYPNHVVTWLLAAGLIAIGVAARPPALAGLANLLLLPHVLVPGAEWTVMNDPSWSIEVEAFFYLLFPALVPGILRSGVPALRRMAVLMAAITIGMPLLVVVAGQGSNDGLWRILYFFPVPRLPEFVLGMALGMLAARDALPHVDVRLGWFAAAAGLALCTVAPIPFTFAATTLLPFALLIVAYAQHDRADGPSRLSGRTWVHFGLASYAFYAFHQLVVRTVEHASGDRSLSLGDAALLTLVSFALALAGAEALYRLVEHPSSRFLRNRGPRPRVGRSTPVAEPDVPPAA